MKKIHIVYVLMAAAIVAELGFILNKVRDPVKPEIIEVPGPVQVIEKPAPVQQRTTFVSAVAKFYMYVIENDTLDIDKGDKICNISISVPSSATDSTLISADTMTFGGFASDTLRLAPGEYFTLNPPGGNMRINQLRVIVKDEARVILFPATE